MNWLALSRSGALCTRTHEGDAAPRRPEVAEALTETALQECYLPTVFAYVSRRIGQAEEAEDITAEVLAAAFWPWCPVKAALGCSRRQRTIR